MDKPTSSRSGLPRLYRLTEDLWKVVDVHDQVVLPCDAATRAVLFVDMSPGANWGHDCLYIAVGSGGVHIDAKMHIWPPKNPMREIDL